MLREIPKRVHSFKSHFLFTVWLVSFIETNFSYRYQRIVTLLRDSVEHKHPISRWPILGGSQHHRRIFKKSYFLVLLHYLHWESSSSVLLSIVQVPGAMVTSLVANEWQVLHLWRCIAKVRMSILVSGACKFSRYHRNGHTYFSNTTSVVPLLESTAVVLQKTYVHFGEWRLQILAIPHEWTYVLFQYNVRPVSRTWIQVWRCIGKVRMSIPYQTWSGKQYCVRLRRAT